MGNEACTADTANCVKEERNILPWARSDPTPQHNGLPVDGLVQAGGYKTAHGSDISSRYQGHSPQQSIPTFRSPLSEIHTFSAASGSMASPGQRSDQLMQSVSPRHPRASNEGGPEVKQDDWQAVSQSPRGSPNFRARIEDEVVHLHSAEQEEDRALEALVAREAAKQCYFDLEVGEAGPAQSSSSDARGRERRWHRFRTGATYDGEWLGGMRDGIGKQCWPDGTVYVGEWRRGRAGGSGEMRHSDGDVYTGQFVNGRAHGSGVFRHQGSHAIYEGEFQNDMREGLGVELWVDGSWYAGDFRKGAKHGFGEHRWPMPPGTYYVGRWGANELSGPGRYFVKDGPSYEGEWTHSVIDGIGLFSWPDGRQYEGGYQMDKKHGFGILVMPDGKSQECFWEKGNVLTQS
mmetsp:Transcript_88402/g.138394  ORF Transcript_88402/g.138394 Transcript_88402/m.138394 type:complete len:404 (+) Transcript_88402:32-1243(+)